MCAPSLRGFERVSRDFSARVCGLVRREPWSGGRQLHAGAHQFTLCHGDSSGVAPYLLHPLESWEQLGRVAVAAGLHVWSPRTMDTTRLACIRRRYFACASNPCRAVVELSPVTTISKSYPVVFALTSWTCSTN
jgi:hypothetical protein